VIVTIVEKINASKMLPPDRACPRLVAEQGGEASSLWFEKSNEPFQSNLAARLGLLTLRHFLYRFCYIRP
jgi:hypothetical protein